MISRAFGTTTATTTATATTATTANKTSTTLTSTLTTLAANTVNTVHKTAIPTAPLIKNNSGLSQCILENDAHIQDTPYDALSELFFDVDVDEDYDDEDYDYRSYMLNRESDDTAI
jgi:hypothetical protein